MRLKYLQLALLSSSVFYSTTIWAETLRVDSQVNKVTVYQQQGMIERQAKVTLSVGEHTLRFPQLSNALAINSLQFLAKGAKPLLLLGVEAKQGESDFSDQVDYQEAEKALKDIKNKMAHEEDNLQLIQRQMDLLDKLETGFATGDKAFNLEQLQQLQGYTTQTATQLFKQRREGQERLAQHQKALVKTQEHFDEVVQKLGQRNTDVFVKVKVAQAGQYDLSLNYTNAHLTWQPSYQLYYDSQKQQVTLRAYAQLSQHTGEDWQDIQLVFSSGQPISTSAAPETQPWIINYYEPRALPRAPMSMQRSMVASDEVLLEGAAPAAVEIAESVVETSPVAALFTVPNKVTIPSQSEKQSVLLNETSQIVSSEYAYYAQYQDGVFVTINAKNTADYPLLGGELQTFYDGRFIGKGQLATLYPQQSFTQLMGLDQTITVKKSPLKRVAETSGVINKSQRVKFEQAIEFSNARDEAVDVLIHNRVPSSAQKEIIVEVQQPSNISLDNLGRYQQKVTVPAKKSLTVQQAFTVEYPKDKRISGL